jgi:hypothetical protein
LETGTFCTATTTPLIEIEALGARVGGGEQLALRCWCAPRKCHGDLLANLVAKAGGAEVKVEDRKVGDAEWQARLS